ncbi:Uncharacterised protein [Bordetella pertussis]|nr:Uncharacterised protein [Bordetella pertussis]CFL86652.1 Uncharacterised protein [Bordetella pertussis]CFM03851.1 Uncharacterised protein [Bordetella pertussis]CFM09451.1 Uncharacterised protein [Bordetella pertussis]CFM39164.1 Uncharacterised protein [Bordetella pertussis]
MSGANHAIRPAPVMATAATQYAPCRPMKWISAAPANGPANTPMRMVPASVDRARARM